MPGKLETKFNVHAAYEKHLASHEPPISAPLAAVLAITDGLNEHNVQTASEGLSILSTITAELKSKIANPIPVAAGTDTFRHQLVTRIARSATETPGKETQLHVTNFEDLKKAAIGAGKDYVDRGIEARATLATSGQRIISDNATVLVPAPSKTVTAILDAAATAGTAFSVAFIGNERSDGSLHSGNILMKNLQKAASVYDGPATTKIITLSGASALLSDGSVMAAPGTLETAILAEASGNDFWVAAELFKCVRYFQASKSTSKTNESYEIIVRQLKEPIFKE